MSRPDAYELHRPVIDWYHQHARDLPWRHPDCTPWGIFVSEVMLQQTPVARVEPAWHRWMTRWPTPADLATDAPGEAVRAWDRLGYPRRALRLHAAAEAMVHRHHGAVPDTEADLLALPGVGAYTAAAVAAFAYGRRTTVVDTNIRRVHARLITGSALPHPSLTRAETTLANTLLPTDTATSVHWNVAVMELGALICTARSPQCGLCPVTNQCAWRRAGSPPYVGKAHRGQAWHGTDRQARGAMMAVLRSRPTAVTVDELHAAWPQDPIQRDRCLASLIEDGLVDTDDSGRYHLPR
ncbi:Adenine DNA glycosylase [Austwickia sp. TVS 96-490-7B]|uniref:A/G-specific adenine glycosylase n=1 Tax=Austwickia sp. TVS 96-490-7B TaxID=2830843 RepID=UPI001D76518B|nr:A/G-specific adenine glycosylase [Austwickia sp. TVS 96-490-7B]MBW3084802.1 Adenine DNA glycosylase [Austwickia sp. TVS 96-490-7B]